MTILEWLGVCGGEGGEGGRIKRGYIDNGETHHSNVIISLFQFPLRDNLTFYSGPS